MRTVKSVEFFYELPSGTNILVQADVTPGHPATRPCLANPGEPAEDPTAQIQTCYVGGGDDSMGEHFDPDGLWFRAWASTEMVEVVTDIQNKAIEKFMEEPDNG